MKIGDVILRVLSVFNSNIHFVVPLGDKEGAAYKIFVIGSKSLNSTKADTAALQVFQSTMKILPSKCCLGVSCCCRRASVVVSWVPGQQICMATHCVVPVRL